MKELSCRSTTIAAQGHAGQVPGLLLRICPRGEAVPDHGLFIVGISDRPGDMHRPHGKGSPDAGTERG